MLAKDICRHASLEAKGGAGMVALAGEKLNLVLQDLKLNRDLKVNRVTTTLNLGAGTNGPFTLPADYLRTYDMFFPLQGPNGQTQFLTPITMEQYDAEFKTAQAANYPYEFATDLSTQAQAATAAVVNAGGVASVTVVNPGFLYTTAPIVVFAAGAGGGSGAAATAYLGITAFSIGAAGAGYAPGDALVVVGGAGTSAAILLVATVNGGGGILTGTVYFPGIYSTLPTAGFSTTGGSGTGAAFTVTSAGVTAVTVTAAGSGYTSSLAVSFFGGGGGQATATYTLGSGGTTLGKGQLYIYPLSNCALAVTHRYMRDQPDIVSPETSTGTPWFPYDAYLIKATAAAMMGITGDERQAQFEGQAEAMLRPHLIMEGDEQQTVRAVRLDPRRFNSNRGLRPTKVNPY